MRAIAITRKEGGPWVSFTPFLGGIFNLNAGCGGTVHAIKFDNGLEWDTVNGWRRNKRIRVKMGCAVVKADA